MSCGGNGWFKKNPWLAERSQVTTRWGKKSPTFDDGDDSMEVFPLNAVCVNHIYSVCVYIFDYKLTTRSHAHTLTLKCVLIFESISKAALQVPLSSCSCRNTPVAKKNKKYTGWNDRRKEILNNKLKIKFAALKVLEHHINSLGMTITFKNVFFLVQ